MLKSLVALLTVLFSLYGIAYAQTFNVSTTAQLRTAFENAAVNGSDDTIILAAGTYKTTDDGLGTFKFSDTEAHNLTIQAQTGLTANDVSIDGANTHQVLNLTSTKTATFTIERVTVRNGKNSSSYGGGIYTSNDLIVTNSTISGNTSSYNGGGIYGSTVTVTNSTISGNTASGDYGGGGILGSTVTVTNSTISGNTTSGYYGGGISGSTVTVTNSTISGNTASWCGGGIFGSNITVTNSTISSNTSSWGGGINSSTVTVTNSTISGNTAESGGGGITGSTITVANSTISGNTASIYDGGGISGSNITVTNSTISGNTASKGGGGGISGSNITVTNSTISGNTASSNGGGIYGKGTFINNIFYSNSSDIYFTGASNVYNNYIDYTKLQNESSYTIIKKNNIQPSSGSLNFADSSFRLGSGSVAIDKGLDPNSTTFTNLFTGNTTTLQTVQNALQTDKDGNTRIIGSAIDLGAYEYNPVNNCTFVISPTSQSFTSAAGTGSVTVTASAGSCAWTASSTLSWVTITSGSSGSGNGTVTISVSANTTGATRTGNITIAGQTFIITQSDTVFADVASTYGFYNYINAIYNAGITRGCSQSPLSYCSDDVVTRGAMAAFIIRAVYGENSTYTLTPYFSDVPATHGFFKYVQKMKDAGITAVTGTYNVNGTVTRGAMAAFIARAFLGMQ